MTVGELLYRVSSDELTEWLAYSRIEPFGGHWEDFRTGQVCATVANFAGKALKDGSDITPDHFFPTLGKNDRQDEPELFDDPEAHSDLIMAQVFGISREQAYG